MPSAVMGASGRAMLDAIVHGETDPRALARLGDRRVRASADELAEALRGVVTDRHRAALRRHLATFDHLLPSIAEIDDGVAALTEPCCRAVELVAEIGSDVGRFPTAAAWAATRTKNSHLQSLFLRLRGRRGAKKAIIAVAAEMLRSAWHTLCRDQPYTPPTAASAARPLRGTQG